MQWNLKKDKTYNKLQNEWDGEKWQPMWLLTCTYLSLLYPHCFKILIAQCKFYKRNCIETEQIQNKDGVTQINQKWGSLKCPYHWITPRHFTQCIWNMYLQVHIISYRYHCRKPNLCKISYTLTKPYPLHIDMQFIRNICLKIVIYSCSPYPGSVTWIHTQPPSWHCSCSYQWLEWSVQKQTWLVTHSMLCRI